MSLLTSRLNRRRMIAVAVCLTFGLAISHWASIESASGNRASAGDGLAPIRLELQFQGRWEKRLQLKR